MDKMAVSSSSSDGNFDDRSFSGRPIGRSARPGLEKGSSSKEQRRLRPPSLSQQETDNYASGFQFDMLAWFPKYHSCQKYFVDHAQHDFLVQAFAAFINIQLPFQRSPPIYTCRGARTAKERFEEVSAAKMGASTEAESVTVSLIPYIRRMVCTGMDVPQIMHGFFGNDWQQGVGPQRETERRNYLFAAKSGGWASVKRDYDMLPLETVPFLKPLMMPHDAELAQAEKTWSQWLAMEDWMVGSRAPATDDGQ